MTGAHADKAAQTLRSAALSDACVLADLALRVTEAEGKVTFAADIMDLMREIAGLILAVEALEEAAKRVVARARSALAEAMLETGAVGVKTPDDHFTVSVSEGRQSARIIDAKLIPPDYLRHRDPEPDKALITRALKDGHRVPGAELSNGAAPYISFHSKRSAA